jgi:hypothetical protein
MLQMITRNFIQPMVRNFVGIVSIPLILLYMIAYHLVGVRVTYHWGDIDVKPITPISQGQFLFSRLFPMIVAILSSALIVWLLGS